LEGAGGEVVAMATDFEIVVVDCEAMAEISGSLKVKRSERLRRKVKRPLTRGDQMQYKYQSQEADNTFITSDGSLPYKPSR
jgi:hypothetical protein